MAPRTAASIRNHRIRIWNSSSRTLALRSPAVTTTRTASTLLSSNRRTRPVPQRQQHEEAFDPASSGHHATHPSSLQPRLMKVPSTALSTWCLLATLSASSHFYTHAFAPRSLSTVVNSTKNQTCSLKPSNTSQSQTSRAMTASSTTTEEASTAASKKPLEIFRKDYAPMEVVVETMRMDIDIRDGETTVTSELFLAANPKLDVDASQTYELVLDGDASSVKLVSIDLDGKALQEGEDYTLDDSKLVLTSVAVPPKGTPAKLTTVVTIVPETNTQLSGLYKSGPMYCTQCEATGFRRITYYPDRPDNMAVFDRVRLEASKEDYPVLLANGNLVEDGDAHDGRHYAVWEDPYPKPSYLFCCVAGQLGKIQDSYTTVPSGRQVSLQIFSDPKDADKLEWAMESLKKSMQWDEDVYGLEYDLDLYNIVAVDSFNMGAMENKGLNVFNTACVLADPRTSTDTDYERVEGVIGHEYFHNWTGNRVTCRDWFQLTLKEGLTVFRDQEFSGDLNSKPVKRIEDVLALRAAQFAEDAGPTSHPIRPESYISMDNFYTSTVYNKGAEVVRMYQTLLGRAGFRKGMDLYFERHDGSAVTCDDFRSAMAAANEADLDQFARWYATPGTPVVEYEHSYDASSKTWTLTLTQTSQSTDGPLHIPVAIGLLDKASGEEVLPTTVLDLKQDTQSFHFGDIAGDVVPSILRQFSAPVKLVSKQSDDQDVEDLAFLAARDTDGFNRWEAGQTLMTGLIFQVMEAAADDVASAATYANVKEALARALQDAQTSQDYSILAYSMTLPTYATLVELVDGPVDPLAISTARGAVKKALAREFQTEFAALYEKLTEQVAGKDFEVNAAAIGTRRLRNACLDYLCAVRATQDEQEKAASLAESHYTAATCMTDKVAAMNCLASMDGAAAATRDAIVQRFYDEANGDALVLDKWFAIQSMADLPDIVDRVAQLVEHPDFSLVNPNRCRALMGGFARNPVGFHAADGTGYALLRRVLADLDALNPQISARLVLPLLAWNKYDASRSVRMKAELETLSQLEAISEDLFENVSRGLKA